MKVEIEAEDQHECTQCEYKCIKNINLPKHTLGSHKSPSEERERSDVPV